MTARLRPGSITIDLVDGGIYGDLDHCPKEYLLESAEALLSLLPKIRHKGLWGLGKAYNADCYIYTAGKKYRIPEGIELPININRPPYMGKPEAPWPNNTQVVNTRRERPFRLIAFDSDRATHWKYDWYSKVVGSVKDGHASPETEGVPDHYREPEHTSIHASTGTTAVSRKVAKREPELVQQKLL